LHKETPNNTPLFLNGIIVGLKIVANDIYRIADGKADQNALAQIANLLRLMAESLASVNACAE
jgi:hypothetical protein